MHKKKTDKIRKTAPLRQNELPRFRKPSLHPTKLAISSCQRVRTPPSPSLPSPNPASPRKPEESNKSKKACLETLQSKSSFVYTLGCWLLQEKGPSFVREGKHGEGGGGGGRGEGGGEVSRESGGGWGEGRFWRVLEKR